MLVMALVGNMIADSFGGNNPATVNYAIFTSTFSLLTLFYLIPASMSSAWVIHPVIMIVVDALNAIFFLAGGIALAADLHVHSCSNQAYLRSNEITRGAADREKRCREAQASTAFLWFAWAGYTTSFVVSFFLARSTTRTRGRTASARPRPAMTQV